MMAKAADCWLAVYLFMLEDKRNNNHKERKKNKTFKPHFLTVLTHTRVSLELVGVVLGGIPVHTIDCI